MGLLRVGIDAAKSVLADQWREYFYCESIPKDTLVVKGVKRNSKYSSNEKGNENVITNGSIVAVNEGQCMMIVQQGAIVEFSADAGEFVWENSAEPTIFYGGFGQGLKQSWNTFKKRFTMGGDPGIDQRVYFFNTKEIMGNLFGTPRPVPFRVVDKNIGLDVDIAIRCSGNYSFKIENPILFYKNVSGNVASEYKKSEILPQLKGEFLTALQPAFGKISAMGIRYSALTEHTMEMADAMNEVLSHKWGDIRGLKVVSVSVETATASKEDEDMIKDLQKKAVYRNADMGAAAMAEAAAEAMKGAANNPNGAMFGFMGMNMAQNMGTANMQNLYQMGAMQKEQQAQQMQQQQPMQQAQQPAPQQPAPASDGWKCECGAVNTGKFCIECGKPKPAPAADGWTCSCGAVNKGKFCPNCGAKKPADEPLYKCDKCGWEPADPKHPPKFCPECGDVFNDSDIVK